MNLELQFKLSLNLTNVLSIVRENNC